MSEIETMLQNKAAETVAANDKEAFEIKICHKITGATEAVPVYGSNTLGQVVQGYGTLIGLKAENNKFLFYNEQATPKRSTSDQNVTIAEFGIGPGDKLGISDEGSVAAK
ncbi:MAG: hypothetical protein IKJ99_09735 [Oscillospiraceae bacterium]|nr:hypothetical protein [Oscillospiraceae bacterium]